MNDIMNSLNITINRGSLDLKLNDLNHHLYLVHYNFLLVGSAICGHSDTLATVTLLPGPEGVTVGEDICILEITYYQLYGKSME